MSVLRVLIGVGGAALLAIPIHHFSIFDGLGPALLAFFVTTAPEFRRRQLCAITAPTACIDVRQAPTVAGAAAGAGTMTDKQDQSPDRRERVFHGVDKPPTRHRLSMQQAGQLHRDGDA
jgi:hypothetical protein